MTTPTKDLVYAFGRQAEDDRVRLEMVKQANEEARDNWSNDQWRKDFAADLTTSVLLGFDQEALVDTWIETERVGFNDRVFTREATGLKAFYMARGGYIEASEMIAEASEIPRDMVGVHVYGFRDKFLNNFAESAQDLRNLAIRRMDSEINRRIHTVMKEAIPAGSPYYTTTPGLSKVALDAAIRAVSDESRSGEVVVVGRSTMVDQIADFEGYGDDTKEEIQRNGVLGTYRGARIVRLRNYKDSDNEPYMPANEMWVMGKDTGKFAFFGGMFEKEFEELDNWYWHWLARRDTGLLVSHPERARLIVDSNGRP